MKLIAVAVVVMGLFPFVSEAQEARRVWANRFEYEMATDALGERDAGRMIAGLLAWEAAYPNSEFADKRTEQLIYAYQRLGQIASRAVGREPGQISILYRIVSLGPTLNTRSPEQVKAIHQAANALLEELTKPGVVAPADAKELATRALALEAK